MQERGEDLAMRFRWDKKYLYSGVTAFIVIAASIAFYLIFRNLTAVREAFAVLLGILSPVLWGFVLAYILNPLTGIFEKKLFWPLAERVCKTKKSRYAMSRSLAILLSELVLLTVIIALFWMVLPQLYISIEGIVGNALDFIPTATDWLDTTLDQVPELKQTIITALDTTTGSITEWLQNNLLPQMSELITVVTSGLYQVVRVILNFCIGIILSVYLLFNKRNFIAAGKKCLYSIFSLNNTRRILKALRFTNRAFSSFLHGQIMNSAIIGVICYVGCVIMKMPYAMLIAVVVGVTNVIPFFGPFIGAIPCAIIVLMVSPVKAMVFLIFILLLQQFDGNVLGPKILSNATGLNGFWVMFAILVGGGLFGFAGMLLGVPTFAVLYEGVKTLVNYGLRRRGLPVENAVYRHLVHIDPETRQPVRDNADQSGEQAEESDSTDTPAE